MAQLWAAAKSMYPDVVIGDWSGVIYDQQTARSGAIVMLRFADAMRAAVLCIDAPPPAPSIDLGPATRWTQGAGGECGKETGREAR
ncbi:MAG: hypothetical protein ABSG83_16485 [Roseiarcus sp.]|jgi:hypothetical protein